MHISPTLTLGFHAERFATTVKPPPRAPVATDEAQHHVAHVVRCHGALLRRLADRLCRSELDADDLVQDVFEKLLRTPIPAGTNQRAWLSRVMHNLFIDQLRHRRSRREELRAEPVAAIESDEPTWWEHLSEADLRAKVALLPDAQCATFELFAFEGKSYEQIAAQLGIAKATVGTRILRARQKLRQLLVASSS